MEDLRHGPKTVPANKLTSAERREVMATVNSPEFRDLSPNQIVPSLADKGRYLASESTMYRLLREEDQLHHRERSHAPTRRPPMAHVASGPNQVWSWDITYLHSPIRGAFFYLYLVLDVWSRRIVAAEVNESESPDLAGLLIGRTCAAHHVDSSKLVLHSDNGGPMKGATMLATLERLGIEASFSRPHVSDDNPFSEALFRTLKYRPEYPAGPFASLDAARGWVAHFVAWYNTEHLHSGIRFVTPDDRYYGREPAILAGRHALYERAQAAHPERWSQSTRCWEPITTVYLNPEKSADTRGLGATAPSGAGQRPVEAHQNSHGANIVGAPLLAVESAGIPAPSKALPNGHQNQRAQRLAS
jgi:transposase InsO family protein